MLVAHLVGRAFTVTMEWFVIVETQASIYTLLARLVDRSNRGEESEGSFKEKGFTAAAMGISQSMS